MAFSSIDTTHADVEYRTNLGQFRADQTAIRAEYARTTGAMSDQALRAAIAQEKLDRAIARSGPDSLGARQATVAYRREMAALSTEGKAVAVSLTESGAGARLFQRDISAASRGALAGTGIFRGLGRAVAFSSTLFIGGTGLVYALRSATHAAEEHQATEHQVEAALAAVGLEYGVYRKQIDDTLASQRALTGFTEDETTRAFTQILRVTGNVASALRYTQIAQQISIGSGRDFTSVSLAIVKALAGQASGLKRLGIEIPKGVNGYRAVEYAATKYANSIKEHGADATLVQQRLNQALHQTEVNIGQDLLPTIVHYETHLDAWLSKSSNQERIQRDINTAVQVGTVGIKVLTAGVRTFGVVLRPIDELTGSFAHTLELAFGTAAAFKLVRFGLHVRDVARDLLGLKAAETGAATETSILETGLGQAGLAAAAGLASYEITSLGLHLTGLDKKLAAVGSAAYGAATAIGLIHDPTAQYRGKGIPTESIASQIIVRARVLAGGGLSQSDIEKQLELAYPNLAKTDIETFVTVGVRQKAGDRSVPHFQVAAPGSAPIAVTPPRPAPADRLTQIQLAVQSAQLAVSRGTPGAQQQLIAALKEEIDYDRQYEAIQSKLYANAKTAKDKAAHAQTLERLQQDEASALDQITQINQANATKRAAAAKAAKEKLAKQRKAELIALTQAPVDLRIAEQTAKAHGASEEKLLAIYQREKAAIEKQLKTLKQMGASKAYILKARQNEAAIQSKIDAINKKQTRGTQDIFSEAAAEFAQYGSNVAGQFGPLSAQDIRGLTAGILLELKKANRTHTQVEHNTRGTKASAIDGPRAAAIGGY